MLRRSKAEVECYVASVQASAASQREKSLKGFQFAKLYFELKEYELAKRYVSTYLSVQKRDPRAHRFLGQIYEAEDNIEKAFGCYRRSVELNPMQKDLVLKIAELLCNNAVTDERAKYWVEKSAKLFPGSPAVYKLKEQLLDCKAPSLAELHKYDVDNTLPSHLGKSQSNSELEVAHQNLQQHGTKRSQLRQPFRKMTDENNELRSSLNSLRENNELLKTQQHETKMSQLRETLRKMTDENKQHETKMSQLRETLRKMTDENNELRSSLNSLRENNELLKTQHETKMSQLRETLRKMTDENNELRSSLNSLRENNELLKTQLLRISKVYDPLTILMDWISDQHLSKIEIQEEREGSEKPQCAKENYTLENCMKLLPMVTGQLQWMPFVDPKLHMSVIQFIYWSLRQIDTGSQDASMTATMERLAEVILKGAVQKGSMQKWTKKSTRSKPKAAHFFKSSSMPLRFLSTLVVLRTAKRMDYLTQAFRSLCVDLKTDEGKILFLQYRCVPIILSHLTISKKCLLFIALNALVEMAMNNDKSE
ncbi:coiled-coil domain-containing protein 138-like isoform X25 [Anas acuta]|uniref:coiled-coil domain-containing protein 138-like isoform X25 n=1 Tax=Anas acuta TaxID=28680 RepID=UPI0035C8BA8D